MVFRVPGLRLLFHELRSCASSALARKTNILVIFHGSAQVSTTLHTRFTRSNLFSTLLVLVRAPLLTMRFYLVFRDDPVLIGINFIKVLG